MELDKALEFLRQAKALGIATVSVNGLVATFHSSKVNEHLPTSPMKHSLSNGAVDSLSVDHSDANVKQLEKTVEEPTAEELLYYSTPFYDELLSLRERGEQAAKEKASVAREE